MRKRVGRWAVGLAVLLTGSLLLWLSAMDRLLLLDHSAKITSVRGWGLERPDLAMPSFYYKMMGGGAQYQWVGNSQILFFHDLKPIQVVVTQTKGGGGPHTSIAWRASVGKPALYDVAAHRERLLTKFAALFQHGGKAETTMVSPEGSRLLWEDNQSHTHFTRLDGTHNRILENTTAAGSGWMADPKRFYTYAWDENKQHKNVIAVSLWNMDDGSYLDQLQFDQPKDYGLMGDCALMPDGSLATHSLHLPRLPLTLYRLASAPGSRAQAVNPTLPAGATVEALVYSPQGDRLAWVINRATFSPLALPLLRRWLPGFIARPQRSASLWVSGTLGEAMHEVGHIPVRPQGHTFYLLDYVRWQPDGKTLSFVSNDNLYTVPVK